MEKKNIDWSNLGFGYIQTDKRFVSNYKGGAWDDGVLTEDATVVISECAGVLQYAQTIFEGMKAYRTPDGDVQLFRPIENIRRLNNSADRLCLPQIDEDLALEVLTKFVEVEKDWVPKSKGTSLYIRPFIIATEPFLGVSPSSQYKFIIILSPVGAYYKEGINPVKIAVENQYVRSVKGGTGTAKTGGNYSASLKAQEFASKNGCSQVLWLDGVERKYIEEVGAMNIFFKINGEVVTPMLNGSILDGITRTSIIELLKHWNIKVTEKRISIDEIYEADQNGQLEEVFGTGTAAVISPVGELVWKDKKMVINNGQIGELSQKLYDTLTGIQNGEVEDPFNWVTEVKTESLV